MNMRNWVLTLMVAASLALAPQLLRADASHSGDGGSSVALAPAGTVAVKAPGLANPAAVATSHDKGESLGTPPAYPLGATSHPFQAAPPASVPHSGLTPETYQHLVGLNPPDFFDSGAFKILGWHHTIIRKPSGEITADLYNHNLVMVTGKNYLLNAGLAGTIASQAELNPWYLGLIGQTGANNTGTCTTTTALTLGTAVATTTGEVVTLFNAGAGGTVPLVTTINPGVASNTAQTLANACVTAITSQAVIFGPVLSNADTAASHAGWIPVPGANITNSIWPTWTPVAASAGSTSNTASPAVFTMAASGFTPPYYIQGMFLTSSNVLTSSAGTIYSEFAYTTGAQSVGFSYTVTDTYTVTITFNDDNLDFLFDKAA